MVRFTSVSNIFNFSIRRMSASEIHARAVLESQDDPVPVEDNVQESDEHNSSGAVMNDFDLSGVPLLEESPSSPAADQPAPRSLRDARSHGVSRPAGKRGLHDTSGSDSGHNSSTGGLLLIIYFLLTFNFVISSSFFAYLL